MLIFHDGMELAAKIAPKLVDLAAGFGGVLGHVFLFVGVVGVGWAVGPVDSVTKMSVVFQYKNAYFIYFKVN